MKSGTFDVVVSLGTDHHPFNRLVDWLEAWRVKSVNKPRILLQHGFTAGRDHDDTEQVSMLGHSQLLNALSAARVAVCHGGPGTIFDCRSQGLLPVVVPRSLEKGEHVDDHQTLFTRRLDAVGLIDRVETFAEFEAAMGRAFDRGRAKLEGLDEAAVRHTTMRLEQLINSRVTPPRRLTRFSAFEHS